MVTSWTLVLLHHLCARVMSVSHWTAAMAEKILARVCSGGSGGAAPTSDDDPSTPLWEQLRSSVWLSEELLVFRNARLESEYRQQHHLSCCTFDFVWAAMRLTTCFLDGDKISISKFNRPATRLQALWSLTWLLPIVLQLLLSKQRYAAVRTRFHVAHYAVYTVLIYITVVRFPLAGGADADADPCFSKAQQLVAMVVHPVMNGLGRQFVFRDMVFTAAACYPLCVHLMLSEAGLRSKVLAPCGAHPMINALFSVYHRMANLGVGFGPSSSSRGSSSCSGASWQGGAVEFVALALVSSVYFMVVSLCYWVERGRRDAFLRARRVAHLPFNRGIFGLQWCKCVLLSLLGVHSVCVILCFAK